MFSAPSKRPGHSFGAGVLALVLLLSACTSPAASETIEPTSVGSSESTSTPVDSAPAEPASDSAPVEPVARNDTAATAAVYADSISKLGQLAVKGRAPKTGYTRTEFGSAWKDVDRNGCDTRNDILQRDLTSVVSKPGTGNCKVLSGILADPFTGTLINFDSVNDPSGVQIDHVVALSDAWQKGAQQLDKDQRTELANDPLNLLAVQGAANQQKSDGDAATWLPKNKAFRCQFVAIQIDVKVKYGLWVTAAEQAAMADVLQDCAGERPRLGDASDLANQPENPPVTESAPNPEPEPDKDPTAGVAPQSKTQCPANAPVKGNQTKTDWIYHVDGESSSYSATHPERCFETASAALKAGYRAPLN